MKRIAKYLLPTNPMRLMGSCWLVRMRAARPDEVMENLLSRVAETADPSERMMQAQRAIGALMAFTGTHADSLCSIMYHKQFFSILAELCGKTPDELCACAGIARGVQGGAA